MVLAAFDGWLTTGRFNSEFQEKLSTFLKVKHLITVNSGSSANLIAFSSLTSHLHKEKAIKPGDEIISVAAGFPTTVNPIFQNGAVPVFIDIKLPTYNINEELTNYVKEVNSYKEEVNKRIDEIRGNFNVS